MRQCERQCPPGHFRVERVEGASSRWRRSPRSVAIDVSLAFGQQARGAGTAQSTGSHGDCYDNAVAQSFFATLKITTTAAAVA